MRSGQLRYRDFVETILPDCLRWSWFSERHGYDFNGYLIRHPSGNLCIDPVEASEAEFGEILREGVARIVITNRNHTRASRRLRELTGAPVAIHPADAEYARLQGAEVDEELRIGERVGPFTVIDASGKSPGEIALYWPERKILVVGDACVGHPPGSCALLPETVLDDPGRLRRSLRRIAAELDFDALLLCDGEPIPAAGRRALEALVATFD